MTGHLPITASSGNVFDDLGVQDASGEATKLELAVAINDAIDERGLCESGATVLIGATPPEVSALRDYRLSDFSVGRLVEFLSAAGRDIVIGHSPTKDGNPGRVHVGQLQDMPRS